jgi:hypothetical protein
MSGRGMARAFATIAIPFAVLAAFGSLGFFAASALIALLWFAWTRPPGNGPLFNPRPALDHEPGQIDRLASLKLKACQDWCDWCNKRP